MTKEAKERDDRRQEVRNIGREKIAWERWGARTGGEGRK
jgi:hypothetical protein